MAAVGVVGGYAVFTFTVSFIPDGLQDQSTYDYEQQLVQQLRGLRPQPFTIYALREELQSVVREQLGGDVEVDELLVRRGSVEIVLIATTLYKVIKNFNDVIDTIQKTTERLRLVLKSFLDRLGIGGQRRITAIGRPGSGMIQAVGGGTGIGGWLQPVIGTGVLPLYLAISNIVLIVGLLVFLGLRS